MRKIVVLEMISLDGVMQGPGGPTEDESGDFRYGGWTSPYGDEISGQALVKHMGAADYLLGRQTFEIWAPYWPQHGDFWPHINSGTKYVFSQTMTQSTWQNTVFLKTLAEIKGLKESEGLDLQVWGSGRLVQLLLQHDLVDELWLRIYPVLLGGGKKLFRDGVVPAAFRLAETTVTTTGVIMATYHRAGPVPAVRRT